VLQTIPANGSVATQLNAVLRDARDQIIRDDDTTPVRFSLVGGHGLFNAEEVNTRDGLASVALRGLGITGSLTVRAEAPGLETAEL
jgi:hypothetical protein